MVIVAKPGASHMSNTAQLCIWAGLLTLGLTSGCALYFLYDPLFIKERRAKQDEMVEICEIACLDERVGQLLHTQQRVDV